MTGLPAAKAVFSAVRAALRNQRAHSAKFISIVSGFDDNLGILLAPVRVKGAQHFVGLVEVLEHVLVPQADQVERVDLSENVVERAFRKKCL